MGEVSREEWEGRKGVIGIGFWRECWVCGGWEQGCSSYLVSCLLDFGMRFGGMDIRLPLLLGGITVPKANICVLIPTTANFEMDTMRYLVLEAASVGRTA